VLTVSRYESTHSLAPGTLSCVLALIIVGCVALACVPVFGILSYMAQAEMVARVNEQLPAEQRFDSAWWWLGKMLRLRAEYRRRFPEGTAIRRHDRAAALGAASLVVAAFCLARAGQLSGHS
jgi:hypothetical protein